jgi:hypothetical protein
MNQVFMRDADPSGGFQQQQRYFFQIKMTFDNFKTKSFKR